VEKDSYTGQERNKVMYPTIVGEYEGLFLIEVEKDVGALLDIGDEGAMEPQLLPAGPLAGFKTRFPFDPFDGDASLVLALYEDLKTAGMEELRALGRIDSRAPESRSAGR
jgi:hypothetical protein